MTGCFCPYTAKCSRVHPPGTHYWAFAAHPVPAEPEYRAETDPLRGRVFNARRVLPRSYKKPASVCCGSGFSKSGKRDSTRPLRPCRATRREVSRRRRVGSCHRHSPPTPPAGSCVRFPPGASKVIQKTRLRLLRKRVFQVGQAGFEPTTPCTPCKCATRLRYCPFWLC